MSGKKSADCASDTSPLGLGHPGHTVTGLQKHLAGRGLTSVGGGGGGGDGWM